MIQVTPAMVAEDSALPVIGEGISGDPSGKNQKTVRILSAESVDVGNAHFGQVEVGEGGPHFEGIDGVIGLQLFNGLIVTFDYPNSRFNVDGGALPAGGRRENPDLPRRARRPEHRRRRRRTESEDRHRQRQSRAPHRAAVAREVAAARRASRRSSAMAALSATNSTSTPRR